MPLRGIVLDLDETLIDRFSTVTHFAEALWQENFSTTKDDSLAFINKVHLLDKHGYTPRELFFESLVKQYADALPSKEQVARLFYEQVWETPLLADGVIDSLSFFQREGIPLGIVTNGSTKAQQAKIEHSGIEEYFDAIVISEEFGVKKPDPSIYLEAASRLRVEPGECWFVGDHPINDVWGSRQVGYLSAWVHLGRPWASDVERCYDVEGETFKETVSQIIERI